MRLLLLSALLAGFLVSCGPDVPDYPDTPAISFVRFAQPGDSLQVTIHFTDGDGDMGVPAENPSPDLWCWFYHRNPAGQWVPTDGPDLLVTDTLVYPYRIPELPASQKKTMEGDIIVTMQKQFIPNDTIRMDIRLSDRAGHLSNKITTPELWLQR